MEYRIIDALPEHIPQIAAIEKENFSCPMDAAFLTSQLHDHMHDFIAAVAPDGRVLGYVGMTSVLDEGDISNIAVVSDCRRQGIGEALMRRLLALGEARGLSSITLEARESNCPAIALYGKFGFEAVGLRKNYYEKPRESAVLMTYYLKQRRKISENSFNRIDL